MELHNGPTLIQKQEARYRFILRFGPRSYNDYRGLARDLDAGPITVTGHLLRHGTIVAWRSAYISSLEGPNAITKPAAYFLAVRNMNYSNFPADCLGPRSSTTAPQKGDTIEIQWTANMKLIADRESQLGAFSGSDGRWRATHCCTSSWRRKGCQSK